MFSMIKNCLLEATEDIKIDAADATAAPVSGNPMAPEDFSAQPPTATQTGMLSNPVAAAPLNMPQGLQQGSITIQKTVLNKERVVAITAELKSIIATYEKKFEKEDISVENAEIQLSNMLDSLAFYADKLAALIGRNTETEPGSELSQESPEEPTGLSKEQLESSELPPLEELGTEPEGTNTESEETYSNPVEPEKESEFSNPYEAI